MMALLFVLLGVCALLVSFGLRRAALWLFVITLIASAIWFGHHITSEVHLNL